ncbi:MAG: DUF742 domain-containing protein [Angustibacter sp.]
MTGAVDNSINDSDGLMSHDDESQNLHRPFLGALIGPATDASTPVPQPDLPETVRPYLVTGGRVPENVTGFDTVYMLSAAGRAKITKLTFEHQAIAELCTQPQSVAEVSALLRLPLGVACVLAQDLAGQGYLSASFTAADPASNVDLIRRVIHAVHAL